MSIQTDNRQTTLRSAGNLAINASRSRLTTVSDARLVRGALDEQAPLEDVASALKEIPSFQNS